MKPENFNDPQNEVVFFNMITELIKKHGNNQKDLRKALHETFFTMLDKLITDVNYLKEVNDNLEDRLLDSNIEQQGLVAANAAMMDKLKRMGAYANEHEITNKRINELRNMLAAGGDIRVHEYPNLHVGK